MDEKDYPINQNVTNLEDESQQSSKTNKESLLQTDKEKENLVETNEQSNVFDSAKRQFSLSTPERNNK